RPYGHRRQVGRRRDRRGIHLVLAHDTTPEFRPSTGDDHHLLVEDRRRSAGAQTWIAPPENQPKELRFRTGRRSVRPRLALTLAGSRPNPPPGPTTGGPWPSVPVVRTPPRTCRGGQPWIIGQPRRAEPCQWLKT